MLHHQVKVVGVNGQISLGKALAGKIVKIEQIDKSTWVIKSGEFIPDSQKWLSENDNMGKIDAAVKWAEKNPTRTDNSEEILSKMETLAKSKDVKN
ncbi:MAG TPA: hypothetical protein VGV92_06560 [Gammaproteobacteria bacterium]|nr:hypothetical protein [Gammaproteobacteria bacterium]